MSLFILLMGYVAAGAVFNEPRLYSPVAGLLPLAWWTGVVGKTCGIAMMTALIGYRLKSSGRGWKSAGWGRAEPLKELGYAAACAGVVWVIAFFLLADDANQGGLANHAQDDLRSSSGWWLVFLSSCLLTGVKEELVYRGGLRAFLSGGASGSIRDDVKFVLVSGVVFAAGHWLSSPGAYAVYALIGGVFAVTLARSGSLRAVMIAHILVNTAHLYGLGHYVRWRFGGS